LPWASIGLSLTCLALALAPEPWLSRLEYDSIALAKGQLWRLWTAHLVHFSAPHAVANAVAFLAIGTIAERQAGTRALASALAFCAPLIGAGLWMVSPGLATYRGLSALVWSAATLAFLAHWPRDALPERTACALAAIGLPKLFFDAIHGPSGPALLPDGVQVEASAHLLGIVAALLTGTRRACGNRAEARGRPAAAR
jgi:rhomboid family GlyGly-CTERM serine protease